MCCFYSQTAYTLTRGSFSTITTIHYEEVNDKSLRLFIDSLNHGYTMQVLLTWKSQGLSELEASEHWSTILETWRKNYQPLVEHPLHLAVSHSKTLFLGLLYMPEMFRRWQEFYEDDSYSVAWCGISHNLLDNIPPKKIDQVNPAFVSQLQNSGDSFLCKLDGRFVVSILNRKAGILQIITNTFGLTPCFQTKGKYGIAVGTRIVPLVNLVGGEYIPNHTAMIQVFAMDWCLSDDTTFEGVFQVKPGKQLLLKENDVTLEERSYFFPKQIIDESKKLSDENYLVIGSDAVNVAVTRQLRHSKAPLMDLTGGMDSRAIVASAVALGYRPECDISGVVGLPEIELAARVAETMELTLHRIYPGKHYAENINETLRLWSLWTEGMIPAHISFAQSAFALCPKLRKFYDQYRQTFCGAGGETGRSMYYRNEMLVRDVSPEEIVTKLAELLPQKRYSENFLLPQETRCIRDEIQQIIDEGIQLGLSRHKLMDYYYWRQRASRWAGYMIDMQQLGRHVFAPLCQSTLTAVFFSMTGEEHLSAAWHRYHIQRMLPSLSAIPFLNSSPLSGLQKFVFALHPTLFKIAWHINPKKLFKQRKPTLPYYDRQKLGTYFHPYLQSLLFSGNEWWPQIIQYEKGRKAWENFVMGKEAQPLWNLVTIELWARNFLS